MSANEKSPADKQAPQVDGKPTTDKPTGQPLFNLLPDKSREGLDAAKFTENAFIMKARKFKEIADDRKFMTNIVTCEDRHTDTRNPRSYVGWIEGAEGGKDRKLHVLKGNCSPCELTLLRDANQQQYTDADQRGSALE